MGLHAKTYSEIGVLVTDGLQEYEKLDLPFVSDSSSSQVGSCVH